MWSPIPYNIVCHRIRAATLCMAIVTWTSTGAVLHSGEFPSIQDAIDNMSDGDVLRLTDDGQATLREPLRNVMFVGQLKGPKLRLHLAADLVDAHFHYVAPQLTQEPMAKLRRSTFWMPGYGYNFDLKHVDSVAVYMGSGGSICKQWAHQIKKSPLNFDGFVRALTIHKLTVEGKPGSDAATSWSWTGPPVVRINASDPVGNGWGAYIISPIVWQQRAWTPFHILHGTGITIAHINTEYNRWADPVVHIDNGTDCLMLCNGIGAAGQIGRHESYLRTPSWITYPDHQELGHAVDDLPFRGAAFCIAGQRNKIAAMGDYKTWSIGPKKQLPALHYGDGVVARDPFFQVWPAKKTPGNLTSNFADPKSVFYMNQGIKYSNFNTSAMYPANGVDVIRPYLPKIPVVPSGGGKGLARGSGYLGASQMVRIEADLEAGRTVRLAEGTYRFSSTITRLRHFAQGSSYKSTSYAIVRSFLGTTFC